MNAENTELVRQIFSACAELSVRTGRPVSPDGHLVGSLGEVLAAERLGLTLMPPSNTSYDAVDEFGTRVEIKCTTRKSIALSGTDSTAQRLVVVKLAADGTASIVYDGPMSRALELAGRRQSNGQRALSLSKLLNY
ncbi:MAG: hypothetical protein PHU75_05675 [Candidatus Nanopelagicales bacterium]|nr:hypothetical protein [Candidatus Nanopelagicales bacterium]